MTSMELEAYKAELAREILTTNSRNVLDEVKRLLDKLKKKAPKQEEASENEVKPKKTRTAKTSKKKTEKTFRNWWPKNGFANFVPAILKKCLTPL